MSVLEIQPLAWDTDFFGCPCAKAVIDGEMDHRDLECLLSASEQYSFLTAVNVADLPCNNRMIGLHTKGYLADINIQFEKKIISGGTGLPSDLEDEITADKPWDESVLKMAEGAYRYSRFYTDPLLKALHGDKVHIKWLENAFEKPDKYFLTVKERDACIGYILFSMDFDSRSARIELISVSSLHRRQEIGGKMIRKLKHFLYGKGIQSIMVGTQLNNTPAVNFYHKCGFSEKSLNSIYHLWNPEEPR